MKFAISPEALARAAATTQAAEVLRRQTQSIGRACLDAAPGEFVIAVVAPDLTFRGVWIVPAADLRERVLALEDGGWSLVFAPQTSAPTIEERCLQMARLAAARLAAMRRRLGHEA